MSLFHSICRFGLTVLCFASVCAGLYAAEREVPTTYSAFLDAVNVPYVWNLGFTGQNVVVGVVDDSIDMAHPFFSSNIDTSLAYNTGVIYNDESFKQYLPTLPTQSATDTSAVWDRALVQEDPEVPFTTTSGNDCHGTCVTGCIAAYDTVSNTYGPAYGATIAPIRIDFPCQAFEAKLLDGTPVEDFTFSQAIACNNNAIDIKNNSYGLSVGYDGKGSELMQTAIADARENNTILLFSSGNDRNKRLVSDGKDCTKKVYTAHPYTIAVAATGKDKTADYTGFAPFSNYGACVFITAPGAEIQTADREDIRTGNVFTYNCELISESAFQGKAEGIVHTTFNGTSASCPIAAGVLALALDAYKTTYPGQVCDVRYIKQILARTSTKIDTEATNLAVAWQTNAAGLSFSPSYGFGQINAQGLIDAILDPETVLGGNYNSVTPQTVATLDWSTMEITDRELLTYNSTSHAGSYDGTSSHITTFGVTENDFQPLAADDGNGDDGHVLVYSKTQTFTDEMFQNSGILKQDMEEAVVTLTVKADDLEMGFDATYMQIVLDHNGLQSYLAYSDTRSIEHYLDDLTWSFSSNAFWGEDPTGDWTLNVYNVGSEETFSVSDVFSTFYMGALTYFDANAVPEPSAWILLILGASGLVYCRKNGKITK